MQHDLHEPGQVEPVKEATRHEKFELAERLEPIQVYRDGPRFYCAWVSDGENHFRVKDTVHNPDANRDPNNLSSPRSHLRTEIEIIRFLNDKVPEGEVAPTLLASNTEEEPWYASEHLPVEGWLGTDVSPFFFNREALAQTDPSAVFGAIQKLQALTDDPDLPEWIRMEYRSEQNIADTSNHVVQYLGDHGGLPVDEAANAYARAQDIRAGLPRALIHGEVYPPHIFVAAGAESAQFIDWENAKIGDPYSDHVAVWLRAFENPEWQAAYYDMASSQPGFDKAGWDANVYLASIGNFWYLSELDQMEPARRAAGAEFCRDAAVNAAKAIVKTSE